MKSFLLVALAWGLSLALQAQITKTVNVTTAENLSAQLTTNEQSTITNLTLTGTINSNDFATLNNMCTNGALTTIDMASSVVNNNTIPGSAFLNCSKLTSIILPDAVTSIEPYVFYGCSGLTSITIPDAVTSIGSYAFSHCSKLTSIILPNSVTSIGAGTFYGCSKLTSITIPDAVIAISEQTFYGCSGLTSIILPNSVTAIGNYAFYRCSRLTSITIPNSVTSIGDGAFYYCSSLTSITIPDAVTSIGSYAFSHCSKLTSITIPNSVTSIGVGTFEGCSELTSITIPNSVTFIGNQSFQGCSKLTSIKEYNPSATNITLGPGVFQLVPSSCILNLAQNADSISYATADQWNVFTIQRLSAGTLAVSANTLNLACPGGSSASIDVTSNIDWGATITGTASWLSITPYARNGSDKDTLVFTAEANTSLTPRTATVTLTTYDNAATQTITVTQVGIPAGSGTDADPYLIYTYSDLKYIAKELSATYLLMADIDASPSQTENSGEGWVPIGTKMNGFNGKFHGQGHIIRNLYINRPNENYVGFFGCAAYGSVINGVGIAGDSVKGKECVGGLAGFDFGTITDCYHTGTVTGTEDVGGLVGYSNGASITACYNTGIVTGTGNYVGGLMGKSIGTSITTCYNTGTVTGTEIVGGLVGENSNYSNITACYNTGTVAGTIEIGGLLGLNRDYCNVTDSYSAGIVTGTIAVGGFFGFDLSYDKISNCYYDEQISGHINGGMGIIGINTSKMKKEGTFNWNLINTWVIRSDSTYPALRALNNAPFAFRDALTANTTIALSNLLTNDYDYETLQTNLVYKIQQIYGGGTIDASSGSYTFPATSAYGYIDSVRYRVGELIATGDTLWGNEAKAVCIKTNIAPIAANDNLVTDEDVARAQPFAALLQNDTDNDALSLASFVPGFPHHGALTTNIATSEFTYTPAPNWNDTDTLQYVVSDGLLTDTAFVVITVNAVNDAPVITSSAPTPATEEVEYTYTIAASDVDNATLTYTLTNAPAGMAINGNTITWVPTEGITTSGEVALTVSDGQLTATEKFSVIVAPVNDAPVITSSAPTPATEEVEYTYTIAASDVDNATLTYTLTNAPAGMVINNNVITWTPGANVATSGMVTLTVSDGQLSATETFSVAVTPQAIVLATLQTPQAGCAGSNLELSYTVLNGSPTEYQVIFGSEALASGFANIVYNALPQSGNSISIPVPSNITDGIYNATLQVRNSLTESTAYPFAFTINLSSAYLVSKFNDVILVDNSSNRFTAYQWYKNGTAISGATNQYYNDLQGISGSYYARVTTTAGATLQTCPATFSSASHAQEVSVTAYPNPLKTNNTLTVAIHGLNDEELGSATLSIYSRSGAMVYRAPAVTALNTFILNGTDGIYIVYVTTTDGKVYSQKITIIK